MTVITAFGQILLVLNPEESRAALRPREPAKIDDILP